MTNFNYITLFQYRDGVWSHPNGDIITGEHVAYKMHALGLPSNQYYWAIVPDDGMLNTVVVWKRIDGKSIATQTVYDIDDQSEIDLNDFCAGWTDNRFHADMAAEARYGGDIDDMDSDEWKNCVGNIKDHEHEIVRAGLHWTSEVDGHAIPVYLPPKYKVPIDDDIADEHKRPPMMGTLSIKTISPAGHDTSWMVHAETLDDAILEACDRASEMAASMDRDGYKYEGPFEDCDELRSFLFSTERSVDMFWEGIRFHGKLHGE